MLQLVEDGNNNFLYYGTQISNMGIMLIVISIYCTTRYLLYEGVQST